MSESMSRGVPIPIPKAMKLKKFVTKLRVDVTKVVEKKAAIIPGLQGITIAPKKNPYKNALRSELFEIGVILLGISIYYLLFVFRIFG